jgi:hypothetical protein
MAFSSECELVAFVSVFVSFSASFETESPTESEFAGTSSTPIVTVAPCGICSTFDSGLSTSFGSASSTRVVRVDDDGRLSEVCDDLDSVELSREGGRALADLGGRGEVDLLLG